MSMEHELPPSDRPLGAALAALGVNVGRMQGEARPAAEARAYRVLVDVGRDGAFAVYSDPEVEVICRCADVPDDELVRVSPAPIPEEWLIAPIGYAGDGSVADLLAEVIATSADLA